MARAKKPNKSRKTALKRFKRSNPKGNRKPKLKSNESHDHHLRTKKSMKAKRRKRRTKIVDSTIQKRYKKVLPKKF